jgi:carbonic anhydrase/acetyltransferase-like protein (isoleucine patch superfamily)
VGLPGKVIRTLTDADVAAIRASAEGYVNKVRLYL